MRWDDHGTHRVVLEAGDVGLHGALHVPRRHQRRRQVDVAVDEVGLQADSVPGAGLGGTREAKKENEEEKEERQEKEKQNEQESRTCSCLEPPGAGPSPCRRCPGCCTPPPAAGSRNKYLFKQIL